MATFYEYAQPVPSVFTSSTGTIAYPITNPPIKETPVNDRSLPTVAGGAPVKTLFTRYTIAIGGYLGQIVLGNAERPAAADADGTLVWESVTVFDAKTEALEAADAQLRERLVAVFA